MKFPPTYTKSKRIETLLLELEALKKAFTYLALPQATLTYLRRSSLLKSSLYSARIEGNPLQPEDVTLEVLRNPKSIRKREIANIARALGYLEKSSEISVKLINELHSLVLNGISGMAGLLRQEESAIFNQTGVAVHLTPAPAKIRVMLEGLVEYTRSHVDPIPVNAAVSHIWFEKIHPFDDGNGRVGRLLSQAILKHAGYEFGSVLPIEEYLDTHRQEYYDALMPDRVDVTIFVEFFLETLVEQAKRTLEMAKTPIPEHRAALLPRRAEIVDIIADHEMVSFDFLRRRFRAVSTSTLHFDLKQLIRGGYIKKLGTTRAVVYVPGEM